MLAWDLETVRARVWEGWQSLTLVERAVDIENQITSPRGSLPIGIILRCDKKQGIEGLEPNPWA